MTNNQLKYLQMYAIGRSFASFLFLRAFVSMHMYALVAPSRLLLDHLLPATNAWPFPSFNTIAFSPPFRLSILSTLHSSPSFSLLLPYHLSSTRPSSQPMPHIRLLLGRDTQAVKHPHPDQDHVQAPQDQKGDEEQQERTKRLVAAAVAVGHDVAEGVSERVGCAAAGEWGCGEGGLAGPEGGARSNDGRCRRARAAVMV